MCQKLTTFSCWPIWDCLKLAGYVAAMLIAFVCSAVRPSYGCNAPLLYKVLQRLEDKIDSRENRIYGLLSTISILITSEDKSFGS